MTALVFELSDLMSNSPDDCVYVVGNPHTRIGTVRRKFTFSLLHKQRIVNNYEFIPEFRRGAHAAHAVHRAEIDAFVTAQNIKLRILGDTQ